LQEARQRHGLPWEVLERDYLLSWVLAGIQRVDALNSTLVFKGEPHSRSASSAITGFLKIWISPA
jgi:hypothetical protein